MAALALLIHRFAKQVRVGGRLSLSSNGDPALAAAFAELGWSDPYPIEDDPTQFAAPEAPIEAAVVMAPETAVLETPEGHVV